MAQPSAHARRQQTSNGQKKRREHPTDARNDSHKRPKTDHRARQRDARILSTQTSSKAFKNGELDVDKFVKSREYEIRALEEGMARSKKALTTRAFQHVPKELRRRTASHNAKRVPKRLQQRAKREMVEDNTPTVTARKRKPTRHMRLRMETAKQLRALGALKKATKSKNVGEKKDVVQAVPNSAQPTIKPRSPKVKRAAPAAPPMAKAKFRKRQIHKTWLPTHMFHAKRARMTTPKEPLWCFAIPLTPTAKSYRPTHRAVNARGAVAWDASYMSTIGLEGQQRSIEGILKALRFGSQQRDLWGANGEKWRNGTRVCEDFAREREEPHRPIAPITVIWCAPSSTKDDKPVEIEKRQRSAFIRVHPSAFWQLWEEIVRLANVAKPQVSVQDLRFEIGSIEVSGPAANEALHAALWPSPDSNDSPVKDISDIDSLWNSLRSLTNLDLLPDAAMLGFDVQDARLHHPPRKADASPSVQDQERLLEILAFWPADTAQTAPSIFNRRLRFAASSALSSQKTINRRKSLAAPGQFPDACPKDPRIPILLYHISEKCRSQGSFTLLLPWKCVQPIWYSLMYCPLSTGGQPRFGGLDETRQLAFESEQPWFPADFPGTHAGWHWEVAERIKREDEWRRRPKSKRTNWEAVSTGPGKKGEVGVGWACDWERLFTASSPDPRPAENTSNDGSTTNDPRILHTDETKPTPGKQPVAMTHVPGLRVQMLLHAGSNRIDAQGIERGLATVRIRLLTRGVPQTCARIYRLPPAAGFSHLRRRWLGLHPREQSAKQKGLKNALPRLPKDAPAHLVQRRLAQSLLKPPQVGDDNYPGCPGEEDLIGFVTTGNYNLGEGKGTGIGSILLSKVMEDVKSNGGDGKLCIVRNSGNSVGRLASWEVA